MRVLALAALLIVPAATAFAGPVKNGVYQETSNARTRNSASLGVRADGKRLRYLYVTLDTRCRIGGKRPRYPTTLGLQGKGLIKGGRFSQRRVKRFPNGAVQGEWVKGRFSADGRSAVITARYYLRRRDGRCDTGTKRLVVPVSHLNGAGVFAGPWAGENVSFTVERGRITNLRAQVPVECEDSGPQTVDVTVAKAPLQDGEVSTDELSIRFDSFSAEGTVRASSPGCDGAVSFAAEPARALDSRR